MAADPAHRSAAPAHESSKDRRVGPAAGRGLLQAMLGLEYRSLAVFRVLLGLVIAGDLLDRAHDLTFHYTDAGMFPRRLAMTYPHGFWLNPYLINGSFAVTSLLFLLHVLIGLCLALGYHTRLMIFLAYVFGGGLQARNLMVGHGGDCYFRVILFWSIWLPLGKVWSMDRYLKDKERLGRQPRPRPAGGYYLSAASFAYIAQVCHLYVFAYYLKTHEWWTHDYVAAYYALRLEYFSEGMPVGQFLLRFPEWLPLGTWAALVWEGWGPFFYFAPVLHGPLRLFGVVGMIALHLGFSIALRLGTFFWITVCAQLPLIPSWFWDHALPALRRAAPPLDAALAWCERRLRCVVLAVERLRLVGLAVLATVNGTELSRPSARLRHKDDTDDTVLTDERRRKRARWKAMWLIGQLARTAIVVVLALHTLGWNLSTLETPSFAPNGTVAEGAEEAEPAPRWTDGLYALGELVGLDQNWGMFAPRPPDTDYWMVIQCWTTTNDTFELFREAGLFTWRGAAVSFAEPPSFRAAYYNHRHNKYWESYVDEDYVLIRPDFSRWLCREWNRRHAAEGPAGQLERFDVWMAEHLHLLNGSTADWGRTHMWHGRCFDRPTAQPAAVAA